MSGFLTRERFGSAQAIAAVILLGFLAQCLWFCARAPLTDREIAFMLQGERQWTHQQTSPHEQSSPITSLVAALPLVGSHPGGDELPLYWKWLARAPFMILGLLYGASIWYVARRLYGNIAGYIALILYAFSPFFVIHSSTVQPEVIAGWGAFGIVFTAIGVAHSLYALREVVLWNWKRILLLGVAVGVGCAAHGSVIVLVPIALAFMWYLVPERRGAATVIMLAACAVGGVIFVAIYGFHVGSVLHAIVPRPFGRVDASASVVDRDFLFPSATNRDVNAAHISGDIRAVEAGALFRHGGAADCLCDTDCRRDHYAGTGRISLLPDGDAVRLRLCLRRHDRYPRIALRTDFTRSRSRNPDRTHRHQRLRIAPHVTIQLAA